MFAPVFLLALCAACAVLERHGRPAPELVHDCARCGVEVPDGLVHFPHRADCTAYRDGWPCTCPLDEPTCDAHCTDCQRIDAEAVS